MERRHTYWKDREVHCGWAVGAAERGAPIAAGEAGKEENHARPSKYDGKDNERGRGHQGTNPIDVITHFPLKLVNREWNGHRE